MFLLLPSRCSDRSASSALFKRKIFFLTIITIIIISIIIMIVWLCITGFLYMVRYRKLVDSELG